MTIRTLKREEQLKPCPFCGGTAIVHYINDERYHEVRVGCSKCWCGITKTLGRWEQADIKDTIKQWNTRAESEDAISRQAAINSIWDGTNMDIYTREVKESLEALPSVTPQPKIGHWVKQTLSVKPFGEDTVLCDKCGFMTDKDNNYNFCPNCGAKMVKPQESEDKK